MSISNVRA